MIMTPPLRKFALTTHVTLSVGWLGAVIAYLALAISAVTAVQDQAFHAAYPMMEMIGWSVLVPLSVGALLTGVIQSFGTEWGLFRYYWVLVKLFLTVVATTILLLPMPAVSRLSGMASQSSASKAAFGQLPMQDLLHAVGGLTVLVTVTALSVYKPWGRTQYGQRRLIEARDRRRNTRASEPTVAAIRSHATTGRTAAQASWKLYALLGTMVSCS